MPATKSVKLSLGGKPRALRYTTTALVAVEDETGLTIGELAQRCSMGSVKAIGTLVWAGLLHAEPALTLKEAIDLLDIQKLDSIAKALNDALEAALGKAEPDEGNAPATD
jgi:hypothetical protein